MGLTSERQLNGYQYCQETTTYKNEDYHFPQRHGDVAEVTLAVDNSVDPWSQSSAHGEAFSVIMELVDMAESTSCVVFCVAVLVFASGSMHTTWHRFYVLKTPVPKCPHAQSRSASCRRRSMRM